MWKGEIQSDMQWIYSLWNVVPTELPSLQCNMRRYSERDGNKANNFATLCRKLMSHSQKIKTGGKFYVHSHQDHLWSNYILTVFLYKIKSTQSLSTCLSIFWSSCYMIERIKIEAEERNNWSAHKGCTLQPIFISPQFVRHWVWFESEKKKNNKKRIIDSWRHL